MGAKFEVKLEVHKALTQRVEIVSTDPKICRYKEGHSDNSIAMEFDVSPEVVSGMRRKMFGKVRVDPPAPPSKDEVGYLKLRIDQQGIAISSLSSSITAILGRLGRLESYLKLPSDPGGSQEAAQSDSQVGLIQQPAKQENGSRSSEKLV
jgi:hypothetical protein